MALKFVGVGNSPNKIATLTVYFQWINNTVFNGVVTQFPRGSNICERMGAPCHFVSRLIAICGAKFANFWPPKTKNGPPPLPPLKIIYPLKRRETGKSAKMGGLPPLKMN